MGKKRAQKDRAYLTATEWREEWGGAKAAGRAPFKRLPFHCCAISFQPFEDAVCTSDGTVYDIVNAVPYVRKFRRHPVSGEPLELKDLIRLHWHRNTDGEYACPVLGKVFNEHTHIVAVRPTGNVYCWEAVDQLNLKPKSLRDLLTDEPFTRKDIIHIQDPLNLSGKNLAEFDHVKKDLTVEEEGDQDDPLACIRSANEDTLRALGALGSSEAAAAMRAGGGGRKAQAERLLAEAQAAAQAAGGSKAGAPGAAAAGAAAAKAAGALKPGEPDPRLRSAPRSAVAFSFKPGAATWNTDEPDAGAAAPGAAPRGDPSAGRKVPAPYSAKYVESATTTGAASRALTSSVAAPATRNERLRVLQQLTPTKKAYARLHTTLGDLNLELHADLAPATVENFLALAEGGYYNGTAFHRSIRNFMIQGGDPTGTGKGGESVWGPTFKDELDSRLTHAGRGVLSMANSGPHTNGSQFFILYKSAHHLDFKHSVFGRVVGGFDVLTLMEKVPTDDEDRPLQEIQVTGVTVFVNPYKELLEEQAKKDEEKRKQEERETHGHALDDEFGRWFSDPARGGATASGAGAPGVAVAEGAVGGGVGKYLAARPAVAAAGGGAAAGGAAAGGTVAGGAVAAPAAKKAKKAAAGGFGSFDSW